MLSAFVWNWNLKAWGGVGAGDRLNESDWNHGRAASVPFCPVASARAHWSTDLKGLFANIYIGVGWGGCGRYFQVSNTQSQHHHILELMGSILIWIHSFRTGCFCRSLIKVKFLLIKSDCSRIRLLFDWLIVTMFKNLKTALCQTFSTWHPNTFCPYCFVLT